MRKQRDEEPKNERQSISEEGRECEEARERSQKHKNIFAEVQEVKREKLRRLRGGFAEEKWFNVERRENLEEDVKKQEETFCSSKVLFYLL